MTMTTSAAGRHAPLPKPVVHLALAGIPPELKGFAEGDGPVWTTS
jgi:hypothetical protein